MLLQQVLSRLVRGLTWVCAERRWPPMRSASLGRRPRSASLQSAFCLASALCPGFAALGGAGAAAVAVSEGSDEPR